MRRGICDTCGGKVTETIQLGWIHDTNNDRRYLTPNNNHIVSVSYVTSS